MSSFSQIDFSKLPAPDVIQTPGFEVLLEEMKAEVLVTMPELAAVLELESEPVTKVLEVCAYFRMLDRLAFNDGARANMLALATGHDLDALAAFWSVERLEIQAADDTLNPAILQILESDDAFRRRVQLSLEGHSTAGPIGAYEFWALSASAFVRDVDISSPVPGQVLVTVLSMEEDGIASEALLSAVHDALNDEDRRPITDHVVTQPASILAYEVEGTVSISSGLDQAMIMAAAQVALEAYVFENMRLGRDVSISAIHAALHQAGVEKVVLTAPLSDVVVGGTQAALCSGITLAFGAADV